MNTTYSSVNRNAGLFDDLLLNQMLFELTPCEWKILIHVADDLTTIEIAEKLSILPKSVENYRNRIGAKLNLKGVHKLAKFARKHADKLRRYYRQQFGELPFPETKLQLDWEAS